MIEEIMGVGLEVVSIKNPAADGDSDSELMFFVTLALEWKEATAVYIAEFIERTPDGEQGRRLKVMAVESSESPIQAGNVERRAEARADGIFRHVESP